jgi:hypothetical protein
VRAGIGPDDAVEGERTLDHLALEPAIQEIGRTLGEEIEQQTFVSERETE